MRLNEKISLKLLNKLNPELSHNLAIKALGLKLIPSITNYSAPSLNINFAGLNLENPIGLAAGFDKNAEAINSLSKLGFGFLEIGGVTPLPQDGNPKPRLFRLQRDKAIINRLGFNNKGMKVIGSKLKRSFSKVPVGINLGANRDSKNRIEDYSKVLLECGDFVDFATLNISSPNTSKLRELQEPDNLKSLLLKLEGVKKKLKKNIPIFVKISPDLKDQALEDLINVVTASNVDGIIATNTTISRRNLTSSSRNEIGGLSGKPLKDISTRMIAKISHVTNGSLPIIGVGGVSSAEDAYDKICAGASAIQLYTALVYEGFSVINKICFGLDKLLHADGHQELKTAIGSKKEKWL